MGKFFAVSTFIMVVATSYAAYEIDKRKASLHSPLIFDGETLTITVEKGASLQDVTNRLSASAALKFPKALLWFARLKRGGKTIKAGEYSFAPGTTPLQLLEILFSGHVIQRSFTIIEGWTFQELRKRLVRSADLVTTLDGLSGEEVMSILGRSGQHAEGSFLPDTYFFPRGTSDADFLRRALIATDRLLEVEWRNRDEGLPLKNPYEALILASIVEKETGYSPERPVIAGVFIRRLKKGMKLQADPTVIYGLGDSFTGNLTRKHLDSPTPYNTYTHHGLPPTPIAMAGKAAIQAVLHPTDGDDLFFVAKGDGTHYFSANYSEHKKAIEKYQLNRNRKE